MSMLFMMQEMKSINGKEISYKILDEPIQIRASLLKEEPEFALLPTNMAANLYNKNVPYKLCAVPVWGTLMVFGMDKEIKNWTDLKGRRINLMAKGMTPDILFRFLAMKNGLDPDTDLNLDYSFPTHTDLANAMIAGLAEVAVLSEPLASMVKAQNKNVSLIFDLDQEWKKVFNNEFSIPQTSLVVKTEFADEYPGLVIEFVKKYQAYCTMVTANPKKSGELAVKYNILPDAKIAMASIAGCNLEVIPSWEVKTRVDAYLEVFYNFSPESIGGKLPDEDFFFKK